MRCARIPTLVASADASSMESTDVIRFQIVTYCERCSLTSSDNDRLSYGNIAQRFPHIALHFSIDPSRELVDENTRWISYAVGTMR